MITTVRRLTLAAFALAAPLTAPALADSNPCAAANPLGPTQILATTHDGLGGSLIWLHDRNGGLWLCDVDVYGSIAVNVQIEGDLLMGSGPGLIGVDLVRQHLDLPLPRPNPMRTAERICQAVAPHEPAQLASSVPDGLRHEDGTETFLVLVKDAQGDLFLCDASGWAEVFAYEPVGKPFTSGDGVDLKDAGTMAGLERKLKM